MLNCHHDGHKSECISGSKCGVINGLLQCANAQMTQKVAIVMFVCFDKKDKLCSCVVVRSGIAAFEL